MCLKTFIVNDCSLHNIKKKYWTPAQPVVFPQGIKRVFFGIKNQLQKKHTRTNERTHAYTPTHTRTHANSHTTWTTERRLYICKIDFILSKSENRKVEKKKQKKNEAILSASCGDISQSGYCYITLLSQTCLEKNKICWHIFSS